jgi:uncharacterized protein
MRKESPNKIPVISLLVKVQPNASTTCISGREGGYLKIRLAAPAVDGKANMALIEFLAEKFRVPKSWVTIRYGVSSKKKVVEVRGCSQEQLRQFSGEFV